MYIDSCTSKGPNGKSYTRHLLRDAYRNEEGRVRHHTIANLSKCTAEEVNAIRLALRHKGELAGLLDPGGQVSLQQGPSVGAVLVVQGIAKELGLTRALGASRQGKLALWQVIARVLDQGSRLSAVRLAGQHAAGDLLGLDAFDEDALYANLDWLCAHQADIEDRLFGAVGASDSSGLFLYDVTSSYFEGTQNELSAFGYNRDGKRGKRQVVIGLLCNGAGVPLSIEVFPGNTSDSKTVAAQVRKVAARFGGGEVTFVGDRGMLKSTPIEDVLEHGFHYITAITKPQIDALLADGVLDMSLFDHGLGEVTADNGRRYILRRNPLRAAEMSASRDDKLAALRRLLAQQNAYLAAHPKATLEKARQRVVARGATLRLDEWVAVAALERTLSLTVDAAARARASRLDGCYVLQTDLSPQAVSKEVVHERYRSLALVEQAFRTSKTVELEMRPIHVRLETRTRGHAFVVMLAYRIVQRLAQCWRHLDVTVAEGLAALASLCAMDVAVCGTVHCAQVPTPRDAVRQLVEATDLTLPAAIPRTGVVVATRKKLPERRVTR
ncbi:MAG: IS1634 family transposase [Planctomycetes bacterium]|nr:IS1634 family transposase [Planctomycetota bacterium]